jgi:hypothetical protein
MSLYPGTARVVHGYQPSLLVLVLATAGAAMVVLARGRAATLVTAGALLTAACLTHVVLFALFASVVALFALLSIPDLLRDRRAGMSLLATDAGAAAVAVLPAMFLGAGAIYGWLGVRLGSTINTTNVASTLHQRTLSEVRRIRPFVSGPLAVIGAVFGRIRGRSRTERATARFGLSWLAVTMAGTLLGLVGQRVAGHRFLLFAVPVPALAGLGVVAVGWLVARREGVGWKAVGAAVAAGLIAAVAAGGVSYFSSQTNPRKGAIYPQLRVASAYLDRYGDDRPVVFVIDDRRGALAAYSPKYRSYVIKAGVPDDAVARTYVFPGSLEDLQAGRPTILPEVEPWQRTFNQVSRAAWEQVEPALRRGAVVLIAEAFAVDQFQVAMQQDPGRRIAPGVYAVRGPARPLGSAPTEVPFGVIPGAFTAAGLFLTLVILGWGMVATAVRPAGASLIDVTLLAPAAGAAVAVMAGFLLAAVGADPGGTSGLVALLALSAASGALGWRGRGIGARPSLAADHEPGPRVA